MWGQAQARAQDLERCQLALRLTEQQLSDRSAGPQVFTKIQQVQANPLVGSAY